MTRLQLVRKHSRHVFFNARLSYHLTVMAFPTKTCIICSEEFELKPDKPGFANRCPECSSPENTDPVPKSRMDADERKSSSEANAARREAMRNLLYHKDS
jgi:hypothetical protein